MKNKFTQAVFIAFAAAALGYGSALSTAASGLTPGQSVNFSNGTGMSEASFAWQSDGVYDAQHQLVHVMGKPANADQSWQHASYNIASGQWTAAQNLGWNAPGHIYGNFAGDPATGDLFQSIGGHKRVQRYIKSSDTWTELGVDVYAGSVSSHFNGVAWHPNLYGQGDGGLVVQDENRTMFWRKSTNTVQDFYTGAQVLGANAGDALYFAAIDKIIVGQTEHVTVSPNGGNKPTVVNVGAPPIHTGGLSTVYNLPYGGMVQHPGDPSKILLLERRGSHRVWESTDGDHWTLKSFSHPFDFNEFEVISLPDYGVLWAVGANGSTGQSKLWKPDDNTTGNETVSLSGSPFGLTAAPNPFATQVNISVSGALEGAVKVFDARGKMIAAWPAQAASGQLCWNAAGFPVGLYLVNFRRGNEVLSRRIVLQR